MRIPNSILEGLAQKMCESDSDGRLDLLESVDNLHVMMLVSWVMMEAEDHKDHGEGCSFSGSIRRITEEYLEAFTAAIMASVQATCEVNGRVFAPDPNKEVRDEIMRESRN